MFRVSAICGVGSMSGPDFGYKCTMTFTDCRGSAVSATDQAEVNGFDNALELFLNYETSAGAALKTVMADHPGSVMAPILRGNMLMMLESTAVYPKVAGLVSSTAEAADHANERERLHLRALGYWAKADVGAAATVWERLLAMDPRDLLALKMHHYTTFWTGRAAALLSVVDGVIDMWDESIPGYDHVLGMQAFALNETGRYEQAEEIGRRAVALNDQDLWSVHSVAHALEMQGDHRRGDEFFAVGEDAWPTKNPFLGHIWWHAALFPWNAGDYERVLDLYDNRLRPASTEFYLDIQNLSSLLTRLELAGVDVGDRWGELGDYAAGRTGDHVLAFTDVHCALTLARTDRVDELDAFVTSLADHRDAALATGDSDAAQTALLVAESLASAAKGDHQAGSALLSTIRCDLAPIGGSHAQRDLFDLLLADMTAAAGDLDMALHQLRARTRRWPNSVPTWQRYGETLAAANRRGESEAAHRRAAELVA